MRLLPRSKRQWVRFAVASGLLVALAVVYGWPLIGLTMYEPQEGDVVFQPLPRVAGLVRAIEGATGSPYSHCGVVVRRDGKWCVAEALGTVHYTPLSTWVRRGRWGRFAAYRLKPRHREHISAFVARLQFFEGLPYDIRYEMSDHAIYCSELVYKAYRDATGEEMGDLVRLGDLNWEPYIDTIEKYEGGPPPLERQIITPKHLAKAHQLEKVYSFCLD